MELLFFMDEFRKQEKRGFMEAIEDFMVPVGI